MFLEISTEFIAQSLVTILVGVALALLAYLGKSKLESMDDDRERMCLKIEELQDEMIKFKDNYLDRFEKVNRNINQSTAHIIEKFHELEMKLKK